MAAIEAKLENSIKAIFNKQSSELKKINASVENLIKMVDDEFKINSNVKSKAKVKKVEIKKETDIDEEDEEEEEVSEGFL